MKLFEIKKDYNSYLKDTGKSNTKESKNTYIIYNRFTGEQKQKLYTSRKEATDEAEKLNKKQNAYIYLVHKK